MQITEELTRLKEKNNFMFNSLKITVKKKEAVYYLGRPLIIENLPLPKNKQQQGDRRKMEQYTSRTII